MANSTVAKAGVSSFKVPEDSGTNFLAEREPAIAKGPIIGMNLANSITIPLAIFQKGVLSPRPSNPDPLLAEDEVNSYIISDKP